MNKPWLPKEFKCRWADVYGETENSGPDGNSSPDQDEPPVVEPEQTEVDTACGRRVKKRYKSSTWGAW